jgi:aryl-alcohol dehydrogenase-like predicted oxidoreductase
MKERIVIGTWPMSGDYGMVSLSNIEATLIAAYEAGFCEYDVAPNYGHGFMEFALGKVFGGQQVRINSKVGNQPFRGKSFDIGEMERSVQDTLTRLQVASINVLFLHNPRDEFYPGDAELAFLESLTSSGCVKKVGLSRAKSTFYSQELMSVLSAVQDDCNILTGPPHPIPEHCSFFVRSAFANGALSGRMNNATVFMPGDHRQGWLKGARLKSILRRVKAVDDAFPDEPIMDTAFRYVATLPGNEYLILGCKSVDHVRSLICKTNLPSMTEAEMKVIHDLQQNDFGLLGEEHLNF